MHETDIIEVNGEHVDCDTGEIVDELPTNLANVRDLAKVKPEDNATIVTKLDAAIDLQGADAQRVQEFCNSIVTKLVDINLPAHIRKNPVVMEIVKGQQAMETLSLGSQLALVTNAMRIVSQLCTEDIYAVDGLLDVFRLQAVIASQQQVMQLVQQFTMHMRMLPGQISRMLQDIQQGVTVIMPAEEVEDTAHGFVTALPMAAMLKQAEEQKRKMQEDVYVKPERPQSFGEQLVDDADLNEEGL